MSAVTWNKPAYERHAHVGDALRSALSGVTKAAQDLALYLFEYYIDGRFEWVDLYDILLGGDRSTTKREGKPYARNTMRGALKSLVERGLVIIERSCFGGMFYLTVCHPGPKRPFEPGPKPPFQPPIKISTVQSEIRPSDQISDQIAPETLAPPSQYTEDQREAEQAAAPKNLVNKEKEGDQGGSVPPCGEESRRRGSGSGQNVIETGIDPAPDPDPARPSSPSPLEENPEEEDSEEKTPEEENPEEENPEEREILERVRSEVGISPQLKSAVLKFTLSEVEDALSLLKERNKSSKIQNPKGFLVEALKGRWNKGEKKEGRSYPKELERWYEWASSVGIVDGRPLEHCNRASTISTSYEWIQVAVMIRKEERHPFDFIPYRWMLWRDAMAAYPME